MKNILLSTTVLFSVAFGFSSAHAELSSTTPAASSRAEFCAKSKDPYYFQNMLLNMNNLMAFNNGGGIANGGVCWWHSRFTRAATYLAIYRPELPRPTPQQAAQIIETIRHRRGVVEIPGFRNLREFSAAYRNEIQQVLEKWQMASGAGFGWVRGLAGSSSLSPAAMQKTIEQTIQLVENEKLITYYKMQAKGITAHAWLVARVQKSPYLGWVLNVVDSNMSYPETANYSYGQTQFGGYYAPYIESSELKEARELAKMAKSFCGR